MKHGYSSWQSSSTNLGPWKQLIQANLEQSIFVASLLQAGIGEAVISLLQSGHITN